MPPGPQGSLPPRRMTGDWAPEWCWGEECQLLVHVLAMKNFFLNFCIQLRFKAKPQIAVYKDKEEVNNTSES